MEIDNYMSVSEAAHRWGIPTNTVKGRLKPSIVGEDKINEMVDKGYIKYFEHPNSGRREWIISEDAMREWFPDKDKKF